ncbi:MAG: hypothetical protein M1282_08560, partial [Chloroflexi bacterium]|nr:hypothetical protein [Chloroflexota bacterium]
DSANFNINGNINLTKGQGFFLVIVRGNIAVAPGVGGGAGPNLEGSGAIISEYFSRSSLF